MSAYNKFIQTFIKISQKEKSDYNGGKEILSPFFIRMQTTIIILMGTAMAITSIVNFAKPAYEQFVGKFNVTINIALSFLLGIASAFAVSPYLELQLSTGALILIGLALGTGATIFYDIWKLVQNLGSTKKDAIIVDLPLEDEEDEQD